jgi:hypothetical protein
MPYIYMPHELQIGRELHKTQQLIPISKRGRGGITQSLCFRSDQDLSREASRLPCPAHRSPAQLWDAALFTARGVGKAHMTVVALTSLDHASIKIIRDNPPDQPGRTDLEFRK